MPARESIAGRGVECTVECVWRRIRPTSVLARRGNKASEKQDREGVYGVGKVGQTIVVRNHGVVTEKNSSPQEQMLELRDRIREVDLAAHVCITAPKSLPLTFIRNPVKILIQTDTTRNVAFIGNTVRIAVRNESAHRQGTRILEYVESHGPAVWGTQAVAIKFETRNLLAFNQHREISKSRPAAT